jgi:four helix bundle protein
MNTNPKHSAKSFQDLIVWQRAHELVLKIYQITKDFPEDERFGLTSQMRRSAVSIPANIAEGFKKWSKNDKARFLNIAQSSLEETRYYLILSRDLKYPTGESLLPKIEEVSKLLNSYYSKLLGSEY